MYGMLRIEAIVLKARRYDGGKSEGTLRRGRGEDKVAGRQDGRTSFFVDHRFNSSSG